jgi:hypothetical protein
VGHDRHTADTGALMTKNNDDPITTPGNMTWVPCDHAHTVKSKTGMCEACRGTGRMLILISELPDRGKTVLKP